MIVKVKSKQNNIKIIHKGSPAFKLEFKDKPLEVDKKVADFLKKHHKDMFIFGNEKAAFPDLNNDGKFDAKDTKLAGQALNAAKKLRGKK